MTMNKDLKTINRLNLAGQEVLGKYIVSDLHCIYNGAGPDSWLPIARDVLTLLMQLYRPAVVIHDVQYHESDGTRVGFEYARDCWIVNCRKLLDDEYPLWTWRQLLPSYRRNRLYWYTVMQAGNAAISGDAAWDAWLAAYQLPETWKGGY